MAELPLVGEEFAGYRLAAVLGRGGMSVVYRAENPRLGNVIALKVMSPELAANDVFRARFLAESRIAAAMNHPNVIPIHDTGSSGGLLYIAMRYVTGTDLRQLLSRRGQLPAGTAVRLLAQAARALDAAHRRGLVHRDVKPANLLLERGGEDGDPDHVYLTDFGITRHVGGRTGLTATGELLGTIDYVAPEQIRGISVLGLADQYSLGCVLYECLTGHVPFERDLDPAIMWAHLEEAPVPPSAHRPDLAGAVDQAFARVLAKNPGERYENCGAFVAATRRALGPLAEEDAASGNGAGPGAAGAGAAGIGAAGAGAAAGLILPAPVRTGPSAWRGEPGSWRDGTDTGGPGAGAGGPAEVAHERSGAYRIPVTPVPLDAGPYDADGYGAGGYQSADYAEGDDRAEDDAAGGYEAADYTADGKPDEAYRAEPEVPGPSEPAAAPGVPDFSPFPGLPDLPGLPGLSGLGPRPARRLRRGRRGRSGLLVAVLALLLVAGTAAAVTLGLSGGHGSTPDAASARVAPQAGLATGSGPTAGAGAAMSPGTGMSTGASPTASAGMSMSDNCTSEQPGDGQNGPATLTAVLADASRCSAPAGIIPVRSCKPQAAPPGEQAVVCASPVPGVASVTFRTYPTLGALYGAYTSSVTSLAGTRSFQQNTRSSCGDTGAVYAEAGWNHQELHPRQYTVTQMADGKVPQLDAMGRLACFASGKSQDLVWTTGVGKMLAVATGTGSAAAVYDWWAEIHHVIIFPGTEMCGMSGRMESVPLGNLIQEPVCPAGAGMTSS